MSIAEEVKKGADMYFSIIAGNLVVQVDETTEWAIKREYETSTGSKGVKWEKKYKNLSWVITDMVFIDTDFGEQFKISISDWEITAVLSMGTDSRYFSDFAKKLPNLDLADDITINPYDFESVRDNGKTSRNTGLSITQDGKKILSFYWDIDKKKTINGLPEPEGDVKKFDKDDWKAYFIKVKKFLKEKVKATTIPMKEATTTDAEDIFDDTNLK